MKEASFNIIFILLSISLIYTSNQYIHTDFNPIYNNQYYIGLSAYQEQSSIKESILFQAGVSNNLFLYGAISPINISNDYIINYNIGIALIPQISDKLILKCNYLRSRFNNINTDLKKIDFGFRFQIFNKHLIYMIGYDIIKGDIEEYIMQFDIIKEFKNKYTMKFGSKFDLSNPSIECRAYISLFYSL